MRRSTIFVLTACILSGASVLGLQGAGAGAASGPPGTGPLPPGAIQHVMVIDVENEDYAATFGTPGTYITQSLLPQGELLQNYYAVGHVSLDNYIAQVSGQAPNYVTNTDCLGSTGQGAYNDVVPRYARPQPGRVPRTGRRPRLRLSLERPDDRQPARRRLSVRRHGPTGGFTPRTWATTRHGTVACPTARRHRLRAPRADECHGSGHHRERGRAQRHRDQVKSSISDQYADRHEPFVFFHSVTGDPLAVRPRRRAARHGHSGIERRPDTFSGHLAEDLAAPHHTAVLVRGTEPVQRRARRHLRRYEHHGRHHRWPHGGEPLARGLDAPDPRVSRLPEWSHARDDHRR